MKARFDLLDCDLFAPRPPERSLASGLLRDWEIHSVRCLPPQPLKSHS